MVSLLCKVVFPVVTQTMLWNQSCAKPFIIRNFIGCHFFLLEIYWHGALHQLQIHISFLMTLETTAVNLTEGGMAKYLHFYNHGLIHITGPVCNTWYTQVAWLVEHL